MPIKIRHIPPLLQVETLINGELPPAIFLLIPRDISRLEKELTVEQFVHTGILSKELKEKVREEVNMVIYRGLEVKLRAWRSVNEPGSKPPGCTVTEEDNLLQRMADLWPKLSDEQRDVLDNEGSTCFSPSKKFTGEF